MTLNDLTLIELSRLTEDQAREALERLRWPNGPVCAHCGESENVTKLKGSAHRVGLYRCNACEEQFTATVGTVMEQSHIPIRTWLMAFAIICSSKKGVSALQLQRQLGLGSYRSAWHMAMRIRHAMSKEPLAGLLKGTIEADETYVGGKPRKGGKASKYGRGTKKVPVVALVERGGRARSFPVKDAKANTLREVLSRNVDPSARLMTDEWRPYITVGREFAGGHERVSHGKGEYARKGGIHVNTAESYFALLKRGVMGSFHHISERHLHRYCTEFDFRWSHRNRTDGERTEVAIKGAEGKRLIYRKPTSPPAI